MRFSGSLTLLALSLADFASAQSCDGGRGTCKYTSDCHAPAYTHIVGLCPGPTNYQCCIPTGCVVCGAAEEERDLESRIPCC
ncbi:hypothetical protein FB451DRAFT_1508046 [Mycena latifolia]|nr:hypothetical protein FB451DRAFT_1508046 [Mycena latifolia]